VLNDVQDMGCVSEISYFALLVEGLEVLETVLTGVLSSCMLL